MRLDAALAAGFGACALAWLLTNFVHPRRSPAARVHMYL
jgi:hypothetical protein